MSEQALVLDFLKVSSKDGSTPAELVSGHFDIVLAATSWDARCLALTETENVSASLVLLIVPELRDEEGLRDTHDRIATEFWTRCSDDIRKINTCSSEVESGWEILQSHVLRYSEGRHEPLRLLVDLSACCRYFTLGLISLTVRYGLARRISVFYAEAQYSNDRDLSQIRFTDGRWKGLAVPYCQGQFHPEKKTFYLVSAGFEGNKILRFISRHEPDRVSILMPDPGFKPEYARHTEERNTKLIELFCVPDSQIVRANAGSCIDALTKLTEASVERWESENVAYLCCGTKPHSLALVIQSILRPEPSLLYISPSDHNLVRTSPSGVYRVFDILDLSQAPADNES